MMGKMTDQDADEQAVRDVVRREIKGLFPLAEVDNSLVDLDRGAVGSGRPAQRLSGALISRSRQFAVIAVAAAAVVGAVGVGALVSGNGRNTHASHDTASVPSGLNPAAPSSHAASELSRGQTGGHLTLSDVAELTGYQVQANPGMRASVDSTAAMKRVPEADYVVGSAKLGLLLNTGPTGPTTYEWHDVWVVVTSTREMPQALLAQGVRGSQSGAPSAEMTGNVAVRTIVFVDANTGAVVRSVTP